MYTVKIHPSALAAFVYRDARPRCLLTFSRLPSGTWTRSDISWFERASPEAVLDIQAEALRAILAVSPQASVEEQREAAGEA